MRNIFICESLQVKQDIAQTLILITISLILMSRSAVQLWQIIWRTMADLTARMVSEIALHICAAVAA